ncbi:AAA-like domain-containing protein [Nostoc sp.]|uniref:AAA-like domain-containing protein n=1 Tax=Nostoc sp. TaxID=1180 RepID=UPI002FFB9128
MKIPQYSAHSSHRAIDLQRLLHILDDAVNLQVGKHFNTLQTLILHGVWMEQSYQDIAQTAHCSETHIKKVGAELWELLSTVLAEPVSKKTLRAILERRSSELLKRVAQATLPTVRVPDVEDFLEFPDGPVKLDSPFYIKHPAIETKCHQVLQQPGGFVRLQAPSQMGKTTLLNRILLQAKQQGYLCVSIDIQLVGQTTLQHLDRFLQWLCIHIASSLQLPTKLNDYWDITYGSKISCQNYFKNVLLPQLQAPLILAIDKLDLLFAYPNVADDFFALLCSWYEQSKYNALWQKLRLILVYSMKHYVPLNLYQSPFNVGVAVELPELSMGQVSILVDRHGLIWTTHQLEQLVSLVSGHPHLIRLALYHIAQNSLSLDQLLYHEFTESNPFYHHLQQHFRILEQNPKLVPVLLSILMNEPINANSLEVSKLYQMGLIRVQRGEIELRCELYRYWLRDYQSLQVLSNTFNGDENLQALLKRWFLLVQVYRLHSIAV